MKLGPRLRTLREKRNLTQVQLAKKLNITSQSLSQYELNKRTPDVEMINKLANFFNVSIDYLFGRTDNKIFHTVSSVKDNNNASDKPFDEKQEDLKNLITFIKNLTPEQIKSINNLIEAFNSKK